MGVAAIKKMQADNREPFVEAPRPRRERPICEWVRDSEEGQLFARRVFESEMAVASEKADYTQAA